MQTITNKVRDLFQGSSRQFVIPIFQREYVWSRNKQLEDFWNDFLRLYENSNQNKKHFLGAIVLQNQDTQLGLISKHNIIDGQQRITTIQILFMSFYEYFSRYDLKNEKDTLASYIFNNISVKEKTDVLKLYPTPDDLENFNLLVEYLREGRHTKLDNKSNIFAAFDYFNEKLLEFSSNLLQEGLDLIQVHDEVFKFFNIISEKTEFAQLTLDIDEDPQLIFEVLNNRGTPLLISDLIKNEILLNFESDVKQKEINEKYFLHFTEDKDFWYKEMSRGRTKRRIIDWFYYDFISYKKQEVITFSNLFLELKDFTETLDIFEFLEMMLKTSSYYKNLLSEDYEGDLLNLVRTTDILKIYSLFPLILQIESSNEINCKKDIAKMLESYLWRRAILKLTTSNYNRFFNRLILIIENNLLNDNIHLEVESFLTSASSDTDYWPTDVEIRNRLKEMKFYSQMSTNPRKTFLMKIIEDEIADNKKEDFKLSNLQIEHLLPQAWEANWDINEIIDEYNTDNVDDIKQLIDHKKHTLGNLTLLTGKLNNDVSNYEWKRKYPEISKYSALVMNSLLPSDKWNLSRIDDRTIKFTEILINYFIRPNTEIKKINEDNEKEGQYWKEDEFEIVLDLYFRRGVNIPKNDPELLFISSKINRSTSSILLRCGNFAGADPEYVGKGLRVDKNVLKHFDSWKNNRNELNKKAKEHLSKL